MRILILGGSGMLGHKLWQTLSSRFETCATVPGSAANTRQFGIFDESRLIGGVTAEDFGSVERAFAQAKPAVVVNCIGVLKQAPLPTDPEASIVVNSLFPHRVARLASEAGARMIHLSTDCVFSGRAGKYSEDDLPDATDLYGRSKLLGELDRENCLTIRTSMIGRELKRSRGLLEWFLFQGDARVRGFKRAIFSGLATPALSEVILRIITDHPELSGIWHVAGDRISKFDLLTLVKQTYGLAVEIEPDDSFVCDRSLNGSRFRDATGIQPPSWVAMIKQVQDDRTPYDQIRTRNDP